MTTTEDVAKSPKVADTSTETNTPAAPRSFKVAIGPMPNLYVIEGTRGGSVPDELKGSSFHIEIDPDDEIAEITERNKMFTFSE